LPPGPAGNGQVACALDYHKGKILVGTRSNQIMCIDLHPSSPATIAWTLQGIPSKVSCCDIIEQSLTDGLSSAIMIVAVETSHVDDVGNALHQLMILRENCLEQCTPILQWPVTCLRFMGDLLFVGFANGMLQTRSYPSLECTMSSCVDPISRSSVTCLRCDPLGLRVGVGLESGRVLIVHASTLQVDCAVHVNGSIASIDFSEDASIVHLSTTSGSAAAYQLPGHSPLQSRHAKWQSWSATTGWEMKGVQRPNSPIDRIKVAKMHEDHIIAVADACGLLKLFRFPIVSLKANSIQFVAHSSPVAELLFTKDDRYFFSAGSTDLMLCKWKVVLASDRAKQLWPSKLLSETNVPEGEMTSDSSTSSLAPKTDTKKRSKRSKASPSSAKRGISSQHKIQQSGRKDNYSMYAHNLIVLRTQPPKPKGKGASSKRQHFKSSNDQSNDEIDWAKINAIEHSYEQLQKLKKELLKMQSAHQRLRTLVLRRSDQLKRLQSEMHRQRPTMSMKKAHHKTNVQENTNGPQKPEILSGKKQLELLKHRNFKLERDCRRMMDEKGNLIKKQAEWKEISSLAKNLVNLYSDGNRAMEGHRTLAARISSQAAQQTSYLNELVSAVVCLSYLVSCVLAHDSMCSRKRHIHQSNYFKIKSMLIKGKRACLLSNASD
jgi:hypothetical protein